MMKYQCKACGGIYLNPQRDGSSYFHSCAPVHNPAYEAQFKLDADGNRVPLGPLDPAIPEMLEHPAKRDENVKVTTEGKTVPKADGAGKDTLP